MIPEESVFFLYDNHSVILVRYHTTDTLIHNPHLHYSDKGGQPVIGTFWAIVKERTTLYNLLQLPIF